MATARKKAGVQLRRQTGNTPPETSNDAFFDALIRHQIGLLRVSKGTGRRVREVLDATEKDMRNAIRRRMRNSSLGRLERPAQVQRLDRLLKEVTSIRAEAHAEVEALYVAEMNALAVAEVGFVDRAFKTVVPTQLDTTLPTGQQMRAIVSKRPFAGKTMRQWSKNLARADIDRINSQIRIGLVQGEAPPQIARRIVGTASLKGANGVTEITRRNAEGIARTATNAIANEARQAYFAANAEFFSGEIYVATLDGVTTPICRSLDGQRFPIGEGRFPPIHFNCRSLRVALLDPDPIGKRPMKPVTERTLVREFAEQNDLGRITGLQRKNLPFGTKGQFDAFARTRTRELIGRTPAKVDYETWLGRQSAQFQDDVLGQTKGALFRRGDLPLDRFVDASDAEKTLSELARSDADAFVLAGFDPKDFL